MRTQLVVASTALGLAAVTAARRAGLLRAADRQVLACRSTGAAQPAGFDAVLDLDAALAPLSAAGGAPREADLPVWQRHLRAVWDLGDGEVDLLVEGVEADPALALCRAFADARIDVWTADLIGYGPTRTALPAAVGARVERLLHPDLVPGLALLLLRELGVPATVIPTAELVRATGGEPPGPEPASPWAVEPVALLLGLDPATAGLLTREEEADLYAAMVTGAVAAGYRRLELEPHQSAGPAAGLRRAADRAGATLTVLAGDELVEARFARGGRPALVVGCCSTALASARWFGLRTASVGTRLLLERLTPYENGLRVPVTIVAATVPELDTLAGCSDDRPPPGLTLELNDLVRCVGYCMQPDRNPDLRAEAVRVLRDHPDDLRRYVERSRLTRLDLPGRGLRLPSVPTAVRRVLGPLSGTRRPRRPTRP